MRPELVDFHCHLDLYPDLSTVISACDARRAATLAVTTTPKAFARNRQLASNSEFVRVALGLHPQLVEERASELDLFKRLLRQTRYVGEVGLDAGRRHYRSFDLQKHVFRTVLSLCADAGNKILSVHSVRATKHVLDIIEECLPEGRGTIVLHWFTGSAAEVRRGVDLGCYFSVNEQMLSSPNGCRVLREVPGDRLLTETDGPFVERSGKPIEPGDVWPVLNGIAEIREMTVESVRAKVVKNLGELLSASEE
ncbi:MAG: TatD family hydrolase [Candidatus Thiodiazotropha endolucinida]|nr:TatD family hydrolase [Candidatus Thiodiazotropha taylori]MCW4349701.1 TatD family hydrolase [Candidatus Thiodiazotropha endolucinida]